MKKFQIIQAKIVRIVSQSTIHGLASIVNSEYLGMKLFWLITFAIAVSYSSYLTIQLVINYLSYGILVSITYVTDYSLDFPAVAFCNLNPKDLVQNNSTNTTDKIYYTLDEMLITCTFNSKPCDKSLFTNITSVTYGDCYAFNAYNKNGSNRVLRSGKAGRDFGLSLQLFAGTPSKQAPWISTTGIVVAIYNSSSRPLFSEEGIKVKTGVETNLMLTRREINRLPKPFSNCIEDVFSRDSYDSNEYRLVFNTSIAYRQSICLQRCSTGYVKLQNMLNGIK